MVSVRTKSLTLSSKQIPHRSNDLFELKLKGILNSIEYYESKRSQTYGGYDPLT